MLNSRAEPAPVASASSTPRSLGHAIEGLLGVLSELGRQSQTPQPISDGRFMAWEDEEYQYLESSIESSDIPFCDINIMDGKIFIRIARESPVEDPAEYLPRLATIVPIDFPIEA